MIPFPITKAIIVTCFIFGIVMVAFAGPHDIVIVQSGGPSASEQAQQQIDRLAKQIASTAGWDINSVSGKYFDSNEEAAQYIQKNKPGFVLGDLGFYLQFRDQLSLKVFNQATLRGKNEIIYYVVALKGTLKSLADLKGKTLLGAHLENPKFIERIVFDGAISLESDVKAEKQRSLRALRKLKKGEADAVLLDEKEHASLSTGGLPFQIEVDTIFTSRPVPNNGFMTVGKTATAEDIKSFAEAAKNFCNYQDAKEICKDFDIQGFKPIDDGFFSKIRNQYKGK